jgi:putative endopeptidase
VVRRVIDDEEGSTGMPIQWSPSTRLRACLIGLALLTAAGGAWAADAPQYGAWGFDLTAMDRSVKPGNDFNQYASGAWLARTQIPPDKAIASLRYVMSDQIEARLHTLMETAAAAAPPRPVTLSDKVGAFYKAFMDDARVNQLGASAIAPELQAVRDARDRDQLAALMGREQVDFEGAIFALGTDVDLKNVDRYAVYIGQAGLGLPDRDYYLQASFSAQKAAYQAYVVKILTLIGWPDAQTRAADVVAFETRIAQASWTKTQQRDPDTTYNPVSIADLEALTPGFAWPAFLKAAGLGDRTRVIVGEKSAFPLIAAAYQATPLDTLKAWQAFTIADNTAFYLSAPFSTARYDFRDKILSGQPQEQVRWKRAILAVAGADCTGDRIDCFGNMGFGVGQLYTADWFPPAAKARIEALVANVKAAMRARLERVDWMSPATRAEALQKLDTYQIKVGYPDHPRDYSALTISADDLVGDVRRAAEADWRFYVSRLDGPVDRSDWSMTPQTNDAYNGSLRDIVFPAGILQAPLFDPVADPAINYGGIGAVIGHELSHGFDHEGRKLDAKGQLRDWWTPADAAAFKARAARLGAQYASYEPAPGAHINGDLTMGENIADLGGLNVALEAYRRSLGGKPAPVIDGFTGDQRVFLGWAQAWRGKAREDYIRKQVVSDPHSPRAFRVIGPPRNIDAWYDAFGVVAGDAYYVAPSDRVRIW